MYDITNLQNLINHFNEHLEYYKDSKKGYNEHSCRTEYIDHFLRLLGWDITNTKGLAPQYREVLAENYSTKTDRPDYSMTLRGVTKFFIEAKKPSINIHIDKNPAFQARKYGWNAKHKIVVLTNFEYLAIYDTSFVPKETDNSTIASLSIILCKVRSCSFLVSFKHKSVHSGLPVSDGHSPFSGSLIYR